MSQLTKARLMLHAIFILIVTGYLTYQSVSLSQFFSAITVFILIDIVYLSSIIIRNMKPEPLTISVKDKVVLITGGSSGIGYSLATEMITSECSHVVLIARNENRLKTCVNELNGLKKDKQKVSYLSIDLAADSVNVTKKIDELCVSLCQVDILINCAGFAIPGEFKNLECQAFNDMINTNYLASVYVTHAVVPHMIKQKFGQLVFLSSIGGQLGVYGYTAYSPSKYAIRGFAEVLYTELRTFGIGVSLVFPPDTETSGFEKENSIKPKITQIISEQGGLWNSNKIAKLIKNGIEKRNFIIGFGSDGYFINALTSGAVPPSTTFEFWIQTLLVPFIRIYMLFMQNHFTNVISNEHHSAIKNGHHLKKN